MERFCKQENIKFKHMRIIKSICGDLIEKYNFVPKTMVTIIILEFLNFRKDRHNRQRLKHKEILDICHNCNVSYGNIYKIFRKFPNLRAEIGNMLRQRTVTRYI